MGADFTMTGTAADLATIVRLACDPSVFEALDALVELAELCEELRDRAEAAEARVKQLETAREQAE